MGRSVKRLAVSAFLLGCCVMAGQANAASPRQLVEIVDFSSPVASPDGRRVAYRTEQASVERNVYDSVWYVQDFTEGSLPVRVADGGVPLRDSSGNSIPATPTWSRDGRWIYYLAMIDGKVDVWRAETEGGGAEPVTRDDADVEEFELSEDGDKIRYRVGATRLEVSAVEEAEYAQGVRIDASVPIGQGLFRSGNISGRLESQRLGVMFNRVSRAAGAPERWKVLNIGARETNDLVSSDGGHLSAAVPDVRGLPDKPWRVARDPAGGRIAMLVRVGDGTGLYAKPDVQLMVQDIGVPGSVVRCLHAQCTGKEITGIQWRPESDEVAFTVTASGAGYTQSMYRWDVLSGNVNAIASSEGMLAGERRWRPGTCGISAEALACVVAGASQPPRLERIEISTGVRSILFDPNGSLARKDGAHAATLLRWEDGAGRQFTGQLHQASRSNGVAPPLFVIYYRCFGYVRGGSGDEWPLAELARRGISTLCINALPLNVDAVERYEAGMSAVESAIEHLSGLGLIDRTKVGMGGLSFGAEVTWWTMMHSDSVHVASVASPGISQQYALLGTNKGDEFVAHLRANWQLDADDAASDRWKRMSPASNLGNIDAPVLMQLPEQEFMHALDYAIPLMRSKRADIYVFPHAPHNKFQPRQKLAVYERNLDWFLFWLLGQEDPNQQKAGQYLVWRAMRDSRVDTAGH